MSISSVFQYVIGTSVFQLNLLNLPILTSMALTLSLEADLCYFKLVTKVQISVFNQDSIDSTQVSIMELFLVLVI